MELMPLSSIDDACDTESEQKPFDTILPLDGVNAANRCDIHDNRNRKNMVPFLKSNYKYKRRVPQLFCTGRRLFSKMNYTSVTAPPPSSLSEQVEVEVERSQHLTPPLSDSYFEGVAVEFIVSAVVIFRDILLNFLGRVAREWRVWCINSNKIHRRLSEMSDEVKRFTSDSQRWRYGAAVALGWSKSLGLEYVNASLKLIYLTLFIAIWMTTYEVEAGTCWMERMDNGKCETLYSKNMTKAQCCGKNQLFSYTERNLSNVESFFALALGGGAECAPCLESCKDVVCGPNKRCVKRKGRPKCICSPQCGSGKKHKKSHKRKQQQQHIHQQNGSLKTPHVIDVGRSKEHVSLVNFHSPITVRDVRSLSSEIHNNPSAVMVLTSPGDPISQSNSRRKNQRIPITTNSTKKEATIPVAHQQHRLHHLHHNKQQQEHEHHTSAVTTRRRHANTDRNKGDKLIITADDLVRPSTERDNDLAESNSLRDRSSTTTSGAGTSVDNHQPHQRPQHGRHHFKKHAAKPRRKINDQNGATNNSVHNGTAAMANRNEMKMAERRRHRTQSFDGFAAPFASSSLDQGFKQQKATTLLYPSRSNNNRELHLGQDYADDLPLDVKIRNGFFSNGFPYPHQELSTDEGRYTHPVCGSDGRTYNTECQLKKRACRTDNTALVVAYRGHCQTSCKKVNCLHGLQCVEDHYAIPHCIVCAIECPIDDDAAQKIDPARAVCGVDGNTYKSTCDINRMVCKIGRSIAVAYPGPCREDRTSCSNVSCGPKMTCLADLLTHRPRCVSCKFKCARKRRPASLRYEEGKLCGTNNRTYYSWCEMKKDSCQTGLYIDIKSIGECQKPQG